MSLEYYSFISILDLSQPSFADHELNEKYNGKTAVFESIGYKDYNECSKQCDLFNKQLAKDLTELTSIPHNIAWEAHPNLKSNIPTISPTDKWDKSELVKLYIVLNTESPITLQNIKLVTKSSIYRGRRDSQFTN